MRPDTVPERVSVQPRYFPMALLSSAFKACKRLIDFTEARVYGSRVNGRHVPFAACLLQFGQNFPGLLQLSSPPINASQTRISPHAVADFCCVAQSKNRVAVIAPVRVRKP